MADGRPIAFCLLLLQSYLSILHSVKFAPNFIAHFAHGYSHRLFSVVAMLEHLDGDELGVDMLLAVAVKLDGLATLVTTHNAA